MKVHSTNFKKQLIEMGRELDSIITFGETVLSKDEINAVTPSYQGALLKSVMKQLDIDANVEIPVGTILNYKFGLKVDGEFEYIDFGNYIVYSIEKQEDTNSYKIVCYDKMLLSMKDYVKLPITYPISVRDYINSLSTFLGLTFANENDTFANYDKLIQYDLYDGIGYTFRDVLDELAQVTASTICLNENDELEIRYITETNDVIDEEFLKDVNVNFGEKFGPINTIVLSRSAGSDNIYYPDNLPDEPYELKISDNQIMNGNNRVEFLPDIYNKLNGLEFYTNDFVSTGICYYDLCDRYSVKIGENIYSCVMFNDEVLITQGLEENIFTEKPEETTTDYTKADKTDRKINQVSLIVDKQNQKIESIASRVVNVSNIVKGVGSLILENAYEGFLHKLSIKGSISLKFPTSGNNFYGYNLYPSENLTPSQTLTPSVGMPFNYDIIYPSDTLYPQRFILQVDNEFYDLDVNYLNYMNSNVYDEFVCEDGRAYIIRRIGINENGEMYELPNEIIEGKKDLFIKVTKNSTISVIGFNNVMLEAQYLLENQYTDVFATEVYVNSEIKQTADEINIQVAKKVNENEIVSAINLSPDKIKLKSNRLEIDSTYFKLSEDGRIESTSGKIGGYNLEADNFNTEIKSNLGFELTDENTEAILTKVLNYITGTEELTDNEKILYDLNNDGKVDRQDLLMLQSIAFGFVKVNGKFKIDSMDATKTLSFIDDTGEIVAYMGLNGLKTYQLTATNVSVTNSLTANNLTVEGNFTNNSDRRLKHNIEEIDDNYVNIIKQLNPVTFEYNQNNIKHIGFIAQDMEKIFNDNNIEATPIKVDEFGYYSINYLDLIGILWKDNQYLHKEIERLKEMIK